MDNEPLKILSIDAWRDGEGWTWNNHYKVGTITREDFSKLDTTRKLLRYLRKHGYLGGGRVTVYREHGYEDVFVEIQARGTREPIIAISGIH